MVLILPRLTREGKTVDVWRTAARDREAMVADLDVGNNRAKITNKRFVSIPDYRMAPTVVDTKALAAANSQGNSLQVQGVMFGGGGGIIIELPSGTRYMVTIYRDEKAPRYPSTLDSLAGMTDTREPIHASVKEAFEEVIFFNGNQLLVPQYQQGEWSRFNGAIKGSVVGLASHFGANSQREIEVTTAGTRTSVALRPLGLPVEISLYATINEQATILNIIVPPVVMQQEGLDRLVFRETMAIETKGVVTERDVVLMKISGESQADPAIIAYKEGEFVETFGSIAAYLEAKSTELPYSPILAATLRFVGYTDVYMPNYQPTITEIIRS